MPLMNFLDPEGRISCTEGSFSRFGNRGKIDNGRHLTSQSHDSHLPWIYCITEGLRNPSEFMTGKSYTDLFFLDEFTALAAGHRPCHKCSSARFDEFVGAWNDGKLPQGPRVDEIDFVMEQDRKTPDGLKKTYRSMFKELPAGTFIRIDRMPYLIPDDRDVIYPWSINGYVVPRKCPGADVEVEVLTPKCTVQVLGTGAFAVSTTTLPMRWI
jgi:hypothetical protein